MPSLHAMLILSAGFLLLTMVSSYVGDDDVAYAFLNRKPTSQEALARIRFVFLKMFASISCGAVFAVTFVKPLLARMGIAHVSKGEAVGLAFLCIIMCGLLIGIAQNISRRMRGRPQRPIVDVRLIQHNLNQWVHPRW
jgi:hypothetical protein